MDRTKFEKANEIMTKITQYNDWISDLKSTYRIDFIVGEKDGSDEWTRSMWGRGTSTADLFHLIIGNTIAEPNDRIRQLEDEFDNV